MAHLWAVASTGLLACFRAPSSAFPVVVIFGCNLMPLALAAFEVELVSPETPVLRDGSVVVELMDRSSSSSMSAFEDKLSRASTRAAQSERYRRMAAVESRGESV
jgi:hypothetical protein